nr:uncharacterized protein LOC127336696 [Lolium perenne]
MGGRAHQGQGKQHRRHAGGNILHRHRGSRPDVPAETHRAPTGPARPAWPVKFPPPRCSWPASNGATTHPRRRPTSASREQHPGLRPSTPTQMGPRGPRSGPRGRSQPPPPAADRPSAAKPPRRSAARERAPPPREPPAAPDQHLA